jgi:RNA polymerase sigma factor (sigma-70 family)
MDPSISPSTGSAQVLLKRYAATNDSDAFQELVRQHADLVYATCLRIVGDPHTADDAGQAVFLVFAKKARSLRADTPLAAWFYRTSVFIAQRTNRERRNRQRYEQEAAAMRAQANEARPDAESLWTTLKPQLDTLLAALPAAERDAVVLRYLAGKSEPEAAQALGCPVGTLSARVSRAIARLRERFAHSGTIMPATMLAVALDQYSRHAAPAHFVSSIHAACLGTAPASLAATTLAEGTMKALFWFKIKVLAAVLIISTLVGVPVTMRLTAGESAPVVKGGNATAPVVEKPTPAPLVIPKTVTFAPHAGNVPLIYERVTQTTCTDRPAIAAVINGLIPEHAIDCEIFEMAAKDEKDAVALKIQCLKAFCTHEFSIEKDGKQQVLNLFGVTDADKEKMPVCSVMFKPDGKTMLSEPQTDQERVLFNITHPEITGTIQIANGGFGTMLLQQAGFVPVCSTAGKPRALHDVWENKVVLLQKYELPISYSLEKVEIVNGRTIATLKSLPRKTELNTEVLPAETVGIGAIQITLAPKSLSGECIEDLLVDVELGAVLHHKRIINCKLGYKLDLPESMPESIRKLAGSDLVLGVRFTMEDTLLDEAQAQLLTNQKSSPEALKKVQERWGKRQTDSDPFSRDLATGVLKWVSELKPAVPDAKKDEF